MIARISFCLFSFLFFQSVSIAAGLPEFEAKPYSEFIQGRGGSAYGTWQMHQFDSYVYTIEQSCYCPLPKQANVYVVKNKIALVEDAQTLQPLKESLAKNYKTIPEWFDFIQQAMTAYPDKIDITLNRYLGYPEKIVIDPSYFVADDETQVKITRVSVLVKKP